MRGSPVRVRPLAPVFSQVIGVTRWPFLLVGEAFSGQWGMHGEENQPKHIFQKVCGGCSSYAFSNASTAAADALEAYLM